MLGVRSIDLPQPSRAGIRHGHFRDLPVLAIGIVSHAQVLRLRRVHERLADDDARGVAFPLSGQGRHTEVMISELNGWPAKPSRRTLRPDTLPRPALRGRPKRMANSSS